MICIIKSDENIFLISASVEGVNHITRTWENSFNNLYSGLHTCYTSVIIAMRNPLAFKITDIAFIPIGNCIFLPIQEFPTFMPFLGPQLEPGASGLNAHTGIIYTIKIPLKNNTYPQALPNLLRLIFNIPSAFQLEHNIIIMP